ncbi:LuxR family transcriptional regulator [Sphingomonas sp. G-3-2-10]|uniref:helix-turn-helix transcriptional regulator n=1 Tax=Sphingomonas sp. G-3-2-10 TaxID=2728838 RepID=UPI00146F613E|nr:LuxR family transcriptional regulator [Sphingomonas sp. G-3-2-10]NML06722.1 LuxR family transcriptional regulator [Sphingomonas sp. G-3-2-10]
MSRFAIAQAFVEVARSAGSTDVLRAALLDCCGAMGVRYFALTHHIDFRRTDGPAVRIHNYPTSWQDWFDANGLGQCDPIHRASHLASVGFAWSDVPDMIKMTPDDRFVLDQAYRVGIGDGFTIPSSVPGETLGSCSFAVSAGDDFPAEFQFICQLVGGFAFEAARRLSGARDFSAGQSPILTDRQRDCVLWAARGKTDWEISVILGVGHETVIQHLKHARERYGVQKRALLAVRALFDGLISFSDILKH